jgi:hypothetical protein
VWEMDGLQKVGRIQKIFGQATALVLVLNLAISASASDHHKQKVYVPVYPVPTAVVSQSPFVPYPYATVAGAPFSSPAELSPCRRPQLLEVKR